MLNQYGDILTVEDLSEFLFIGRNRAYELLKTQQIKGFQIGRVWKIPKFAVEEYLTHQTLVR